jgi:hypothetical protein
MDLLRFLVFTSSSRLRRSDAEYIEDDSEEAAGEFDQLGSYIALETRDEKELHNALMSSRPSVSSCWLFRSISHLFVLRFSS